MQNIEKTNTDLNISRSSSSLNSSKHMNSTRIEERQLILQESIIMKKSSLQFEKRKEKLMQKLMDKQCMKGNQAKLLCASNCQEYAPVCQDDECVCLQKHENCTLVSLKNLNKSIIKNMRDPTIIVQKIDKMFDQIIEKISQAKNEIILMIQKNYGLSLRQFQYTGIGLDIGDWTEQDLIGKNVMTLLTQKERLRSGELQQLQEYLISQIQFSQNDTQQKFDKIKTQLKQLISSQESQFFKNSKIILQQSQKDLMMKYLSESIKVEEIKLLYRASDQNFNTQKFKQNCHQKSNLLFLVQNQNKKKYGAYTPCPYSRYQANVFKMDQRLKSFLFTLSDKFRFNLLNPQFAMNNFNNKDYIVIFGQVNNCNMTISTNASSQKANWFKPNHTYQKSNNFNQTEYCSFYQGQLQKKWRLLQYQVYQVIIKKEPQPQQAQDKQNQKKVQPLPAQTN